jgi:hypothetical protein
MPTVLEGYTTEEQRSILLSLWGKKLSAKGIHKEMSSLNGGKCLSGRAVHNLVEKFSKYGQGENM